MFGAKMGNSLPNSVYLLVSVQPTDRPTTTLLMMDMKGHDATHLNVENNGQFIAASLKA